MTCAGDDAERSDEEESRHDLRAARLAGVVAQRGVDELDGGRHFVPGDTVTQERLHRLLIQRRPHLNQL
jgi:hypothetical protein